MPGRSFSMLTKLHWADTGKKALLILLLPAFFVLKGYNDNFGLIPLVVIATLFSRYALISLAVFGISLILLRKPSKAAVFSLYLLCVFFFFGAFHDWLKKIFKPGIITSYELLLPLIFIFTCLLFFLLRKGNKKSIAIIKYFSYLLVILTVLEAGTFMYKLTAGKSLNDLAGKPLEIKAQPGSCLPVKKPDVFFIVLDGYTSSICLQEDFNYSNEYIDSLLKSNHFFISTHSKSNYNLTPYSLSSAFDMNYLEPGIENKPGSSKIFLQAVETLKNNDVAEFFKKEGYLLKNFGVFNLKEASTYTRPIYDNNKLAMEIDNQTIYSRIMKDIGWNFIIRNIFTGAFRIPRYYKEEKKYHIYRDLYNWDNLLKELQNESDSARFIYVHIMLPHEPFYFHKDGSMVSDTAILLNKYDLKTAYFEQLQYTNRLLAELIPLASKAGMRERVVIIEGDHGFRDYGPGVSHEKEFMNLNTYYFSDHDYSMLYDSISAVNSFRVVLNKYFCQSFPLLKDSSIYLLH